MRSSLHPEFLELAASRLEGPLSEADAQRLTRHLAACEGCRIRAAGYEADRTALHSLRVMSPPRDLWARTSAALDREQDRRARRGTRWRRPREVRGRRGLIGAGFAVLAVTVVVASALFAGFGGSVAPIGLAQATPLDVQPVDVAYVSTRDGQVGVYVGRISRVCPENTAAYCAPIERSVRQVASFASDFVAKQLAISPDGRVGAVVGTSASGEVVYALRFPDLAQPQPSESPAATPIASVQPSARGTAHPSPTGRPSPLASPSEAPSASPGPEAIIDHVIVVGEDPAYSADGSMLAFSAMPADRSSGPDIYVWRVGSDTAVRLTNDHGSIFASWAGGSIVGSRAGRRSASGVTPASFLLDPASGAITPLARSAWRPIVDPTGRFVIYFDGTIAADADGLTWHEQHGGLYLAEWHLFDPNAAPATPGASPTAPAAASPEATPTNHAKAAASASAAPFASAGASEGDGAGVGTQAPTRMAGGSPGDGADALASGSTAGTTSASPAATPADSESLFPGRNYERDPILSWEVRWGPDGGWYGAWIGDTSPDGTGSTDAGSLTVAAVDRATGSVDPEREELDRAPALRGFALGDHRIAWTTPPDPDGTSHVRVLVWTDFGRGIVHTGPGGGSDTLPAF